MEPSTLSAVITTILVVLLAFHYILNSRKSKNLPPGPRGLPLLGSLPFLGSDLHVSFKNLSDIHGSIFSLRLGAKLCVVLSSPETVKEALKDQGLIFANHDVPVVAEISSYGCKDILWAPFGPLWRHVRKITVRELLSSATINGLYTLRKTQMKRMLEEVKSKSGIQINIRQLVSAATMKSMTEMLWGGSVVENGEERETVEREFREAMDELIGLFGMPNISDFYPALAWLDLQGLVKKTRKLSAWLSRIFDRTIEERRRSIMVGTGKENSRRDFLQVLLDSNQDAQMTDEVIKAILLVNTAFRFLVFSRIQVSFQSIENRLNRKMKVNKSITGKPFRWIWTCHFIYKQNFIIEYNMFILT